MLYSILRPLQLYINSATTFSWQNSVYAWEVVNCRLIQLCHCSSYSCHGLGLLQEYLVIVVRYSIVHKILHIRIITSTPKASLLSEKALQWALIKAFVVQTSQVQPADYEVRFVSKIKLALLHTFALQSS